jgi:hypothetical protein
MMDTIAQRLLESVSWGLKMRLYMGAGLSMMDLISDVYMIYTYATTEKQGTALSLAIMVGLCLLFQLVLVWIQAHKGPRRVMLKEMLIVLSGTAPGVHAMRVARGTEQSEYAAMDPELELTFTRGIELVLESIPGKHASTVSKRWESANTINSTRMRAPTSRVPSDAEGRRRLQQAGSRQYHHLLTHYGVQRGDHQLRKKSA